jgi:hypothetical protein
MKGYLVSCNVPKNKQRKQIICLASVAKLMGQLKVGADAQSVTLCERGHNQQDAMLFERLPLRQLEAAGGIDGRAAGGGCGCKQEVNLQKEIQKGGSRYPEGVAGWETAACRIGECVSRAYFLLRFYVEIDEMPEAVQRICCHCSKRREDIPAISDAIESEIFGSAEFTMHILPGLIETFRSLPPALRVQIRKMFDSSDAS